jgi:hypothetical protein
VYTVLVDWVAIADHADQRGFVHGASFSDCTIVGPATLVLVDDGNRLSECDFMRPVGAGVGGEAAPTLYLIDCAFERCRFDSSISFLARGGGHPL